MSFRKSIRYSTKTLVVSKVITGEKRGNIRVKRGANPVRVLKNP